MSFSVDFVAFSVFHHVKVFSIFSYLFSLSFSDLFYTFLPRKQPGSDSFISSPSSNKKNSPKKNLKSMSITSRKFFSKIIVAYCFTAMSRHVSLIDQPCRNSKLCIIIISHRGKWNHRSGRARTRYQRSISKQRTFVSITCYRHYRSLDKQTVFSLFIHKDFISVTDVWEWGGSRKNWTAPTRSQTVQYLSALIIIIFMYSQVLVMTSICMSSADIFRFDGFCTLHHRKKKLVDFLFQTQKSLSRPSQRRKIKFDIRRNKTSRHSTIAVFFLLCMKL